MMPRFMRYLTLIVTLKIGQKIHDPAKESPSYRPFGATMAVFADGFRVGMLSSGCIEADVANHAIAAMETG